ncbi:MAG: PilZ domain-containing protein [Nitrospirota bacterium]
MKNLLIAQDLKPMMVRAMSFLQRADIAIHTAATTDELLLFHLEKNAHLIATHPTLPGMTCEVLCNVIRRSEAMKKVSILLVCNSPLHEELARRCNVNAVLTTPIDTAVFAAKVQELLDVPPRRSYRVVLNIAVEGLHDNRPVMCNSENVSAGGMLIRTTESLPPGSRITCSFYLPDGRRVGAEGVIARVFRKDTAPDMTHYGVQFREFTPGAQTAIKAFVEKEMQRQAVLVHSD